MPRHPFYITLAPLFAFATLFLTGQPIRAEDAANSDDWKEVYEQQARELLNKTVCTRQEVEDWLADRAFPFGKYDPVAGFVHKTRRIREGEGGAICDYHYDQFGARKMINYADQPCRINAYGASIVSCEQVSDGETWPEVLAANIGEPVRNYGAGGFSVYQTYLNMKQQEERSPAQYILFGVTMLHYRNLISSQRVFYGAHPKHFSPTLPYIKANPAKKIFEERANPCPTAESVYNLCDPEWVFKTFKEDLIVQMKLVQQNINEKTPEKSYGPIQALATEFGIEKKIDSPETLKEVADEIYEKSGFYATMRSLELAEQYAKEHGKKIFYFVNYSFDSFENRLKDGPGFDKNRDLLLDIFRQKGLPHVDMLEEHLKDYEQFKVEPREYVKRYFTMDGGHYNPAGNAFCARAIINRLVPHMDPAAPAYDKSFKNSWEK